MNLFSIEIFGNLYALRILHFYSYSNFIFSQIKLELTFFLAELDLIFQECATDGGCTDDETICEYCGKHKQQNMFCCDSTWDYENMHQCYGSQFKNDGPTFQCVPSLATDEYKSIFFLH